MTGGDFVLQSTPGFERQVRRLARQHPQLSDHLVEVFEVLRTDPYNSSQSHPIRKLTSVAPGQGQYRIRSGRFRVRYDISGKAVELMYCGLRRENTYR